MTNKLDRTEFLKIIKGKEDGLLKLKLEGGTDRDKMLPDIYDLYLTSGSGVLSRKWNEQRKQILDVALDKWLFPMLRQEVETQLRRTAESWVEFEYNGKVRELVSTGPYRLPEIDELRVMACHWPERNEAAVVVTLDAEGQVVDFLTLPANSVSQPTVADEQKLEQFIVRTQPRVIAVATGSMSSRNMKERLDRMTEYMKREYEMAPKAIYVDARVARVRGASEAVVKEFPSYSVSLRLAISLARFIQEPLSELAALHNGARELACLALHPLQSTLARDVVDRVTARALIDTVSAVGVDLNRIRAYPHMAATLRFVAGLGARKAVGLLRNLRPNKKVRSRDELRAVLPEHVWSNAIGFLRISTKYCPKSITVLDDTRVHPEDYVFATTMVHDALDIDVEMNNTEELHQLIKDVIEQPHRLKALEDIDLDDFAEGWEQQHHVRKRLTLYKIQDELKAPYADHRPALLEPSSERLFELLTGESDATLGRDQPVTAVVAAVDDRKARCRLDSGLTAFVYLNDLPPDVSPASLQVGTALSCRVKELYKDRFLAILVPISPSEERQQRLGGGRGDDDDDDAAANGAGGSSKRDETRSQLHRFIVHPLFKNVSSKGAEELLRDKPTGEVVFRPAKDSHHIVLTYKFHDAVVNVLVSEQNKPNDFALGKMLTINEYTFEDLNEIVARYVDPIAMYAQEMSDYRKFVNLPRAEVEAKLRDDKAAEPRSLPYYFAPSTDYPGRYMLFYMPHSNIKREAVTVLPSGYRFRGERFKSPEDLSKYFKKHWRSGPASSASSSSSAAAAAAAAANMAPHARSTSALIGTKHMAGATPWVPSTTATLPHWNAPPPQQHHQLQQHHHHIQYPPPPQPMPPYGGMPHHHPPPPQHPGVHYPPPPQAPHWAQPPPPAYGIPHPPRR